MNFDEDGNTPRSGGDGEMLGSIDSGTPTFFRDQLLKDIPHPVARPFAYPQPGETPGSADNPYFNNTELADLLSIVHGQPSANMAERGDLTALNRPLWRGEHVVGRIVLGSKKRRPQFAVAQSR